MSNISRRKHWEKVFEEKKAEEVSWYQPIPETSINLILSVNPKKNAPIIDIGAGDSMLIDQLISHGFTNIYALDISSKALDKAKRRLGEKADLVKWIVSDITHFKPDTAFDFWHDRAVFHFLTDKKDVEMYRSIAASSVRGDMSIGTFAPSGPSKCSNLDIQRYSAEELKTVFKEGFTCENCFEEAHLTPAGKVQNFTFCLFRKS
ncbi:class I SAM-dependent methyltransferase [Cytophagaceae bacterium ABcell3]|nr:class I SAM-dependent methyltransferase [Cytophagaceae bacterium ABcell3]